LLLYPYLTNTSQGESENIPYISETQDKCATLKTSLKVLLMLKPNTSEAANPFCPTNPVGSHANGDALIEGLTFGNQLPSKPSLGSKSSECDNCEKKS